MSLQPFSFPLPQTRFFKAGLHIYKFKIQGGSTYSGMEGTGEHLLHYSHEHEIEDIVRTVLGNLESLQPFTSTHFHVYPYKKRWERIMCEDGELKAYPFTLLLYLEKNTHTHSFTRDTAVRRQSLEEPSRKLPWTDSPLEDAILKDLEQDMEAESEVSVLRLYETELLPLVDLKQDSEHEDKLVDVNSVPDTLENEEEDEEAAAEDSPVRWGVLSTLARFVSKAIRPGSSGSNLSSSYTETDDRLTSHRLDCLKLKPQCP